MTTAPNAAGRSASDPHAHGPTEVEPHVLARTVSVSATLLLMTAAFFLAKTGRDALYFQGDGVYDLPKAYAGIAVLSLPMALLMLTLMRRLGTRRARVFASLGMATILLVLSRIARPGGGALMTFCFMLIPLVFGVLFSSAWLLAADLLERATRKELAQAYGVIGACSILGGTLGALLGKALAFHVEPQAFFAFASLALTCSAAVMATAHRVCPRRSMLRAGGVVIPKRRDLELVVGERYTRLLFTIAMLASLAGVLIEFQFYLTAATAGMSGRASASFFSSFYLALNGTALLVQLLLIPRFQKRLGVHASLFVLPAALFGGTAAVLTSASMLTRSILRITEGGLKSSIHRVNWEQAYLPLSRAQRALAKLLVEGLGARLAEGLAAAIVFVWLRFVVADRGLAGRSVAWVGWLLLVTVILWIALTRALGRSLSAVVQARELDETTRIDIPLPDTCITVATLGDGVVRGETGAPEAS